MLWTSWSQYIFKYGWQSRNSKAGKTYLKVCQRVGKEDILTNLFYEANNLYTKQTKTIQEWKLKASLTMNIDPNFSLKF